MPANHSSDALGMIVQTNPTARAREKGSVNRTRTPSAPRGHTALRTLYRRANALKCLRAVSYAKCTKSDAKVFAMRSSWGSYIEWTHLRRSQKIDRVHPLAALIGRAVCALHVPSKVMANKMRKMDIGRIFGIYDDDNEASWKAVWAALPLTLGLLDLLRTVRAQGPRARYYRPLISEEPVFPSKLSPA